MKKHFILSVLLMFSFLMSAQETVTLKFTSHSHNDSYIPFDFVYVRDITHNWVETLNYPDTTMVLTAYDGIDELENKDSYLSDAFPNPFSCNTNILYSIEKPQQINVQLYSINGGQLFEFNGFLEEGIHCFTIEMDKPQMAFFVVTTSTNKCVKKLLNIGYGNCNNIEVNKINGDLPTKHVQVGDFSIGDLMKYEAVIYDNGNNISNTIIQNQYGDETLVFTFDLNKPTVTTRQVTNIGQTSCVSGGNVTSNGGISVTERGICWSSSHNPTLNNNHASNGDGNGNYTVTLTGLTQNTTYYVRAYAINRVGVGYGDEINFTTAQGNTVPTVTTNQVTNITQTTATGGGNVTSDGGATVTTRGVCWSTNHNPTTSGNHSTNGTGTGSFTANITGLTANTTYYVRAYATNSVGTSYGSEVSFTTSQNVTAPEVTTNNITDITQTTATGGGNVTSDGGASVTARGICWSTSHNPTTSGNHSTNGTGTGIYTADMTGLNANTTYYVRAYATNSEGTSYGSEVSFTTATGQTWSCSILPGKFSISNNGDLCYFAQGNLQYQASTNTWRFATNQYDYIGETNNNISPSYNGWIDLFGWGTSNNNHGANCYQPWSISNNHIDYFAYGSYNFNLYDQTGQADWGKNNISNGGNTNQIWKALPRASWYYIFKYRNTQSGILYAKAKVNNINGVILLPDNWQKTYYSLNETNNEQASFNSNIITAEQWNTSIEPHGAVFLPAAGYRYATNVNDVGAKGYYWSGEWYNYHNAYCTIISEDHLYPPTGTNSYYSGGNSYRAYGQSVRLACCPPKVTTASIVNISPNAATCGGIITIPENCVFTVVSRGVCWGLEPNPTINGNHTSDGSGAGSFTSSITGLTPGVRYYVRAFVTTDIGAVFYGEPLVLYNASPDIPGAINGFFSVSDNKQVWFSKGNLQYQASTNTWKFADNQYDCMGNNNLNGSSSYEGWIDMFGWGTSGYAHGAVVYWPWSYSNITEYYFAYGNVNYDLNNQTGKADWGYNHILNGGNAEHLWRTLTIEEWEYLTKIRNTYSGIRYAKARVNNVNGIILLPDTWNSSIYNLNNTNANGSYWDNVINMTDWIEVFEANGCIFLPAGGEMGNVNGGIYGLNSDCYYWSATHNTSAEAYCLYNSGNYSLTRNQKISVRLVIDIQ